MTLPGDGFRGRVVKVTGFHAPDLGRIEELRDRLLVIDDAGTIAQMLDPGSPGYAAREAECLPLPPGTFLLPGFVDLHIHAPQYPQLGRALDVPLEDWLQVHTFPLEARYADLDFARQVYTALVADLLASGTTTAVYHATLHVPATCLLADLCLAAGQRALVGKVAMDHPDTCPDFYRDASAEAALAGSRAVIEHIRSHPANGEGLVRPILTPRFIPACTGELLAGLGALAAETCCAVQTHCAESDWEVAHVADRTGRSDAEALESFGLLTPGGVLAHAVFLTDSDMDLVRDRGAGVAHCPLSNAYFAGAVFPLRRALERGLPVGLGSDISGGPAGTIWEAGRMAVAASRMLESGTDPASTAADRAPGAPARITLAEAFHLATAGGGAALGLPVGSFQPGQQFDAMLIDPGASGGTLRLWPGQPGGAARLEAILYTASRANIARVWVAGRKVA